MNAQFSILKTPTGRTCFLLILLWKKSTYNIFRRIRRCTSSLTLKCLEWNNFIFIAFFEECSYTYSFNTVLNWANSTTSSLCQRINSSEFFKFHYLQRLKIFYAVIGSKKSDNATRKTAKIIIMSNSTQRRLFCWQKKYKWHFYETKTRKNANGIRCQRQTLIAWTIQILNLNNNKNADSSFLCILKNDLTQFPSVFL